MRSFILSRFAALAPVGLLAMCATTAPKVRRYDTALEMRVKRLEQRVDALETDFTLDSATPGGD